MYALLNIKCLDVKACLAVHVEIKLRGCADTVYGPRTPPGCPCPCLEPPSTVPYAHESGLIARLLGVALEAVNAYGVKLLRI